MRISEGLVQTLESFPPPLAVSVDEEADSAWCSSLLLGIFLFSTILCGNFEYFVDDYDVDYDVDDDSDDDDGDGDGDDLYAGGVSRFPSSSRDC